MICADFTDLADFDVVGTKGKTKHDDDDLVQRVFFTGSEEGSTYGRRSIIKIVAYEGTADISSIDWSDPAGSTFAGGLNGVLFREVTHDVDELPTLVPSGCSFTLSSFAWSETVSLAAGTD